LSQIKAAFWISEEPFSVGNREWHPIATAPADVDLELSIYDKGQYHALAFPCQRDGKGWHDVRANRPMPLAPTHWRLWERKSTDLP
jgi:hypothetical protein